MHACRLDPATGRLLFEVDGSVRALPPLWLRELSEDPDQFDLNSGQRLYDPTHLPPDLTISSAETVEDAVALTFSDGHRWTYPLSRLAVETGLAPDPDGLPRQTAWRSATAEPNRFDWERLDDPEVEQNALASFFRYGFLVVSNTPTEEDSLHRIAARFGPIRETHWGRLFNVRTIPNPDDLAYTGVKLTAHTDNPYRRSVPGIQFLHCLQNDATGGESTIVDGLALAEALRDDAPELYQVASTLPVSFRYTSPSIADRFTAPMLIIDGEGRLTHIRLSTRLDFPPAAEPEVLERFYAARRRLSELAADPSFELKFKLGPGDCLIMDNHRTLHGRAAFAEDGYRFLQGCYIDHDGPESRYRVLARRAR